MKIKTLKVRNYKRFVDEKIFPFHDDMNIIVGNNGSGKTSILQAIVALIGTATQEIKSPSKLIWGGFKYDLLQSGRMAPQVEAMIHFDEKEVDSTINLFNQVKDSKQLATLPSQKKNISIKLDHEQDRVTAGAASQLFQFRGYTYAKQLAALNPVKSYFDSIGNIFWYTEKRDNYSFRRLSSNGKDSEETLREFLKSRYNFHERIKTDISAVSEDTRDIYGELSESYAKVFSDRKLVGPSPRLNPAEVFKSDWFYLTDGKNQYEISEMSAGERAIFPVLIDFANFRINNSIIIIDEIELHLHPPLQQSFLRALPRLGRNNQFIITTHSDYIATLIEEAKIIRL